MYRVSGIQLSYLFTQETPQRNQIFTNLFILSPNSIVFTTVFIFCIHDWGDLRSGYQSLNMAFVSTVSFVDAGAEFNFIDMEQFFTPSLKIYEQKWPSQGQTTNSVLQI